MRTHWQPARAGRSRRRTVRAACAAGGLCLAARGLVCGFVPPPAESGPLQALNVRRIPEVDVTPALASAAAGWGMAANVNALVEPGKELTIETFRPVCPASDQFYGVGKGVADALLGADGQEYRPLAIEALLRVRLEVCVLESFVYEAIIPFVQKKGLGWVLPFRESLDTVIAGTVFAVALNFILFGTTKILAVVSIYHDFIVGAPLRLIGYAIVPDPPKPKEPPLIQINWPGQSSEEEKPQEPPEPQEPPPLPLLVFGSVCKGYGVFAEILKNLLEGLDTFVGRYLAVASVFYVGFKWAHFRLFNDLIPF